MIIREHESGFVSIVWEANGVSYRRRHKKEEFKARNNQHRTKKDPNHWLWGKVKRTSKEKPIKIKGPKNRHEFNEDEIIKIFKMYAKGDLSIKQIASIKNVCSDIIFKILKRNTYQNIKISDEILSQVQSVKERRKKMGRPKLVEYDVIRIRVARADGEPVENLMKQYRVSRKTIWRAEHGKTWKHLPVICKK